MSSQRSVVFAEPVRTAIGAFGGAFKDIPAPNLGAAGIKAAVARAGLRPDEIEIVIMGNVVENERSAPGGYSRGSAHGYAGADSQSRLRLRRPGDRLGLAGNPAGEYPCGPGRWQGEYGSRALPGRARPTGLPDGRWPSL